MRMAASAVTLSAADERACGIAETIWICGGAAEP
jgi:hypothetical protein